MSLCAMPDSTIASWSTGTIISVSLCDESRATLLYANDTTATSRIRGRPCLFGRARCSAGYPPRGRSPLPPVRLATLRSRPHASEIVLVMFVVGVGFARRLEPLNRRVVGLELVGPMSLDPLAHVYVVDGNAADQAEERVVRAVEQDLRGYVRDLGRELRQPGDVHDTERR